MRDFGPDVKGGHAPEAPGPGAHGREQERGEGPRAAASAPEQARTRNPRGQGDRLREALIEAAIELLGDLADVEALSVRAVTARAGVTPTALYLHFADKDELLAAVKDRCFTELGRYCREAREAAGPDPREQLERAGVAYLEFARELPAHYRVLFRTRKARPQARVSTLAELPWPQSGAEAFGDLVRGVAACLPAGRDPFPTALQVWAGLHGYAGLHDALGRFPFPEPASYVKRLLDANLSV